MMTSKSSHGVKTGKKNKVIKLLLVHVFYELNNLTDNIAHYNRISFSFTLRHAYQLKSMYDWSLVFGIVKREEDLWIGTTT